MTRLVTVQKFKNLFHAVKPNGPELWTEGIGVIWASIYHRCRNLIPGWISHAVVDAGIFAIGYLLVFA